MNRMRACLATALTLAVLAGVAGGPDSRVAAEESKADEKPKKVTADDLDWLAGNWRSASPGSTWEELWTAPRAGTLVAVTRWVKDGAPKLYELSAIETADDGLYVRLRHFGPGLAPWKSEAKGPTTRKLASSAKRRAAFENAEAGFPQRIVYHRVADDTLEVKLEGMGDDAAQRMEFKFTRVP